MKIKEIIILVISISPSPNLSFEILFIDFFFSNNSINKKKINQ
jgi:hypothetical protein